VNIYHITSKGAWIEATRKGQYTADSLASEGFIHCSTAAQVLPVARQFYRGQTGLVVLVIDTRRLESTVAWEHSVPPPGVAESSAFPHVYGPIGLDAITACLDLEADGAGGFIMPELPVEDQRAARS
jgi:uncharacterized protein (DUF952 family)